MTPAIITVEACSTRQLREGSERGQGRTGPLSSPIRPRAEEYAATGGFCAEIHIYSAVAG
jgi:hypothetical protein